MQTQVDVNKMRVYGSGIPWTNWQLGTFHAVESVSADNYFGKAYKLFEVNDFIDVLCSSKDGEGKTLLRFFVTKTYKGEARVDTKLLSEIEITPWASPERELEANE